VPSMGLPPPQLEGTRWVLTLDIGRTTFTFMPATWATGGARLELSVAVEFQAGGKLKVLETGSFLGQWLEPEDVPVLVQFVPFLQVVLPRAPDVVTKPTLSDGEWEVVEDEGEGRLVRFSVACSGFRRGSIWLPATQLRFRANSYGQILAPGKDPAFTIRESRAPLGAFFGAFAGLTMGPAALAITGLAGGWALRSVAIVVGRWKPERLEESEGDSGQKLFLPAARLTADDPSSWQ